MRYIGEWLWLATVCVEDISHLMLAHRWLSWGIWRSCQGHHPLPPNLAYLQVAVMGHAGHVMPARCSLHVCMACRQRHPGSPGIQDRQPVRPGRLAGRLRHQHHSLLLDEAGKLSGLLANHTSGGPAKHASASQTHMGGGPTTRSASQTHIPCRPYWGPLRQMRPGTSASAQSEPLLHSVKLVPSASNMAGLLSPSKGPSQRDTRALELCKRCPRAHADALHLPLVPSCQGPYRAGNLATIGLTRVRQANILTSGTLASQGLVRMLPATVQCNQ